MTRYIITRRPNHLNALPFPQRREFTRDDFGFLGAWHQDVFQFMEAHQRRVLHTGEYVYQLQGLNDESAA